MPTWYYFCILPPSQTSSTGQLSSTINTMMQVATSTLLHSFVRQSRNLGKCKKMRCRSDNNGDSICGHRSISPARQWFFLQWSVSKPQHLSKQLPYSDVRLRNWRRYVRQATRKPKYSIIEAIWSIVAFWDDRTFYNCTCTQPTKWARCKCSLRLPHPPFFYGFTPLTSTLTVSWGQDSSVISQLLCTHSISFNAWSELTWAWN